MLEKEKLANLPNTGEIVEPSLDPPQGDSMVTRTQGKKPNLTVIEDTAMGLPRKDSFSGMGVPI